MSSSTVAFALNELTPLIDESSLIILFFIKELQIKLCILSLIMSKLVIT